VTFDLFFDIVKRTATEAFDEHGEVQPIFFMWLTEEDQIQLLPANWSNHDDKDAKFLAMRMALEIGFCKFVCVVHEMWTARDTVPADGVVDVSKIVPPSQRADRGEILMIAGTDLTQCRIGHWEIKRPTKGKPRLGAYQEPDDLEMLSGAFRGLFPDSSTRQ
jgi:hypothetical protein